MNISNREKRMLILVCTVAIGVLYYLTLYKTQTQELANTKDRHEAIKGEYDAACREIATIEDRKIKLGNLKTTLVDKTSMYYPTIIQENIIEELRKLMDENNFKGNLTFTEPNANSVEDISPEEIVDPPKAGLDDIANNIKQDIATSAEASTAVSNTTTSTGETTESTPTATCLQMQVGISFNTVEYSALYNFIKAIESYERLIVMPEINITSNSENVVSGTITLQFYSIPKVTDYDDDYSSWSINNVYGKDILFSAGAATGAGIDNNISDFKIVIRSSSSDLPSFAMGRTNDSTNKTYLTSTAGNTEDVMIQLKEEQGKYYYRYGTSSSVYPQNNSYNEFTLNSDKIVLEIQSEEKINGNDTSAIKLKVTNDTSKEVEVRIEGDDASNPRVLDVTSEGNTVNVIR